MNLRPVLTKVVSSVFPNWKTRQNVPKIGMSKWDKTELAGKVAPAFICGGIQYYCFHRENEMPVLRGFEALDIYSALEKGLSWETVATAIDAWADCLVVKTGRIDLGQVLKIVQGLQKAAVRPENYNLELMYRLASVIFFDEGEDVYTYSPDYAKNKIAFWRLHAPEAHAFFLTLPLDAFLPLQNISKNDFQVSTKNQLTEELNFLMSLTNNLPTIMTEDHKKSLALRMEIVNKLLESQN